MLKKLTIVGSLVALLSGCSNTIEGLDTDLETAAKARMSLRIYSNIMLADSRIIQSNSVNFLVEVNKVNGHLVPGIGSILTALPSETLLNFKLECSDIRTNDKMWTNTAMLQQTLEKNMCYKMKIDYNRKTKRKYKHANWGYCELVEFEKVDCSEAED